LLQFWSASSTQQYTAASAAGRQCLGSLALHFDQQLARRRDVGLDQFQDDSQVDANRHQVLLPAIVQVALDTASLGILGRHNARAGGAQLFGQPDVAEGWSRAPSRKYRGRSSSHGQWQGVGVERRFAKAPLQFLAGERPRERLGQRRVALTEGDDAVLQLFELMKSSGVRTFRWRLEKYCSI